MTTKQEAYTAAKHADKLVSKLEKKVFSAKTKADKKAAWDAVMLARNESYILWSKYDRIAYDS
jgi:hypothetical protein